MSKDNVNRFASFSQFWDFFSSQDQSPYGKEVREFFNSLSSQVLNCPISFWEVKLANSNGCRPQAVGYQQKWLRWSNTCNKYYCLCFRALENISLIWRRHHCHRRAAAIFYLCSALMAIEQWGFLSLPHLLWHGTSVFMVSSEGIGTVTTCFNNLDLSRPRLKPQSPAH